MKCTNCGTENMDPMAFCTVCGTAMASENSVSTPPAPPAPVQDVAPVANPAPVSAPTAVADPPVNQAPQMTAPGPMQGQPTVPGPMQGPPMGPSPMQGQPQAPGPMQGPPMGPGPMQGPPMGPGPMQGPPIAPPPEPIWDCGQCKKPFGPEEPFCTNCGAPRQMAIARPIKPKMSSKTIKTILIIVLAVVVLIGAAFGIYALIRNSNYNNAIDDMNAGNYAEAYEAFESLGEYKESVYYADECDKNIRYYDAVDLMDGGNYADAKEIFDGLEDFSDSALLARECQKHIDYDKAISLYNAGEYYDAYKLFVNLGNFEDSSEWADKCVQPDPENSLLDQGSAYATGSSTVRMINVAKNFKACFLIYTGDGEYWGMFYVEMNGSASSSIAAGTYYIVAVVALPSAKWFGTEIMFGGDGTEIPLIVNGQLTFNLPSSSIVEFTWGSGL